MSEISKFVQKVKPIWINLTGQEVNYPLLGLPHISTLWEGSDSSDILDGATGTIDLTAANWGAGQDFFFIGITMLFAGSSNINENHNLAPESNLSITIGIERDGNWINVYRKEYYNSWTWNVGNTAYLFGLTVRLPNHEFVDVTDTVRIYIRNETGRTIDSVDYEVQGVAIAPS